jgi:hypothetical protein
MDKNEIKECIKIGIDDLNLTLDTPINWNDDETLLFDNNSTLDSVNLVYFLLNVEQLFLEKYGIEISITGEGIFELEYNPIKNVKRLVDYIDTLINKVKEI